MVTSAQCGQAPHAASESSAARRNAWNRMGAGLPGRRGIAVSPAGRAPATAAQLLRNCRVAGDVILLMSELGANVTAATHPAHDRSEKEERP